MLPPSSSPLHRQGVQSCVRKRERRERQAKSVRERESFQMWSNTIFHLSLFLSSSLSFLSLRKEESEEPFSFLPSAMPHLAVRETGVRAGRFFCLSSIIENNI